ncbi:MAG: (2Fe-2S)-binding protein [Paracoccaceae bacterium]|nr:(2Fe-2S)-binding protein [Paracoccaceae bacterium]
MTQMMTINLTVNGEAVTATVPPHLPLVDFLRETLGLTGTHLGCVHGVCGACTLKVDGQTVRSCLMLAVQADGTQVQTVEGMSDDGTIADLQEAFHRRNALQCGFCTPGMLATSAELLAAGGVPTRAEIREHISGNYCRCTGYQSIVDAVEEVAIARSEKTTRAKTGDRA